MWKNTTKQQITGKIACSEKRTKNRKENEKMSNNQETSLQYSPAAIILHLLLNNESMSEGKQVIVKTKTLEVAVIPVRYVY